MTPFRTGNVVKIPVLGIVIITKVTDDYANWISFDHENSSGGGKMKDYIREESCFCNEQNDGRYDEDCPDCKGTGSYKLKIDGLEKAKVLAPNVKAYIIQSLTKNFNW